MNTKTIFLAILSGAERDGWIHPKIINFRSSLPSGSQLCQIENIKPVSAARNHAAREFLKSGFDWLAMLDNDMCPPVGLLDILAHVDESMDVVVPQFKGYVNGTLTLLWTPIGPEKNGWQELESSGAGFMLVRRRVFEGMKMPYFSFKTNEEGAYTLGEDINFCHRARAAGFRIFGNTNFSSGHAKTVVLGTSSTSSAPRFSSLTGAVGRAKGA